MCLCLGLLSPATLQSAEWSLMFQSPLTTLQTPFPEGGRAPVVMVVWDQLV